MGLPAGVELADSVLVPRRGQAPQCRIPRGADAIGRACLLKAPSTASPHNMLSEVHPLFKSGGQRRSRGRELAVPPSNPRISYGTQPQVTRTSKGDRALYRGAADETCLTCLTESSH